MREWELSIKNKYLNQIITGQKTIEGRAPDSHKPYNQISKGDKIKFNPVNDCSLEEDELVYRVYDVKVYSSVREMIETEGLENITPHLSSVEEAIESYHSFHRYEERIEKYGICAIHLE